MGRTVDDFIEPEALLEEFWFFGNLLHRKPKIISRSLSDPGTSLNFNREMDMAGRSFEETYESIRKRSEEDESRKPGLTGVSSIKPGVISETGRKEIPERKTSSDKLLRAPSLPNSLGSEEYEDEEEREFSMGKLIRQASVNNSDANRRRAHQPAAAKGVTLNSNISRNPEPESLKSEGFKNLKRQRPVNRIQTQKSLNHVESLQYQGFKDLSFDFHEKCSLKNVISTVPEIQEEEKVQEHEGKNPRGLHRSESAVPKWAAENMSAEDMKAQLKFWARAVASNVRLQEC